MRWQTTLTFADAQARSTPSGSPLPVGACAPEGPQARHAPSPQARVAREPAHPAAQPAVVPRAVTPTLKPTQRPVRARMAERSARQRRPQSAPTAQAPEPPPPHRPASSARPRRLKTTTRPRQTTRRPTPQASPTRGDSPRCRAHRTRRPGQAVRGCSEPHRDCVRIPRASAHRGCTTWSVQRTAASTRKRGSSIPETRFSCM